tara:strand:- start:92 stop:310 length:219 start_codon:yes stop_codon:yes gene_type:complete
MSADLITSLIIAAAIYFSIGVCISSILNDYVSEIEGFAQWVSVVVLWPFVIAALYVMIIIAPKDHKHYKSNY